MKYIIAFVTTLLIFPTTVFAQENREDDTYGWNQRHKAKQVVLNHLFASGNPPACTEETAPMGCERRVSFLVDTIFTSSRRHGVDPWAMVALAFETTNFNPFYANRTGYTGLIGIPMEITFRRHSPFFVNPTFRENCRNEAGACQAELIEYAISRIAESMREHEESLARTLQRYSRLRLTGSRARFSRHVLRRARRFRAEAALLNDYNVCAEHPMVCDR